MHTHTHTNMYRGIFRNMWMMSRGIWGCLTHDKLSQYKVSAARVQSHQSSKQQGSRSRFESRYSETGDAKLIFTFRPTAHSAAEGLLTSPASV